MTRHTWVLVHRYAGLYMAFFLMVAGLTGSVLAFYHEIDHCLNPELYRVPQQAGAMLDPFELRERAIALVPQAEINFVSFRREPGEVYTVMYTQAAEATEMQHEHKYSMLRLNPYSGELIALSQEGGYWPLNRKNILNFIYDLHYKLALGEMGLQLFGITALIWTLDCFVGFYLTLPAKRRVPADKHNLAKRSFWSRWAVAWKIRLRSSNYRLNFDLHRAGGLWTWVMLFVFAWSSVNFNLQQVYQPVMQTLFAMTDIENFPRAKLPTPKPKPAIDWYTAHALAQHLMYEQGRQTGFNILSEDWLSYDAEKGVYGYMVRSDQDFVDEGGLTSIYFDGDSGALLGSDLPSNRNIGVSITYWLVSLHMAHVGGLPFQIIVCVMGLVVAALSITGVYLWFRKRRARGLSKSRRIQLAQNL